MTFAVIVLPDPPRIDRVVMEYAVTDHGKPFAVFASLNRATAYAGRLNQIMERKK